jgi:hypothetical protein
MPTVVELIENAECVKHDVVVDQDGRVTKTCLEEIVVEIPKDINGNPLDYARVYSVTVTQDGKSVYKLLAKIPKQIGLVHDPYYDRDFFIAFDNSKLIRYDTDFDSFIDAIRQLPRYYIIKNEQYLEILKEILPRADFAVSPGLDYNGFIDPYGILDLNDYGIENIINVYNWIREYYPESNARWAWINVLLVFAKLLSPVVRKYGKARTFNDQIVYNVGEGGIGKSSLNRYIICPLLGGEEICRKLNIYVAGAIKSDAQLRNLVALNRMPLILDEQTREALKRNVSNFLSTTIGYAVTAVHASRYGLGIEVQFPNLRGIKIDTNVPFSSFLSDILREASDYAITRRFVVIPWDVTPIKTKAFKDLPDIRPALGFINKLWLNNRDSFLECHDILCLTEKLTIAIVRDIMTTDEKLANEMADYTLSIIKELKQMIEEQKIESLDPITKFLNNAYMFAESMGITNPTMIKILRYILENPQKAGVVLVGVRDRDKAEKYARDLDAVMHQLAFRYNIVETQSTIQGTDPDATIVYSILKNAYDNAKYQIAILAKSALIPGTPTQFMGSPKNNVPLNDRMVKGYYLSLAEFVKLFLHGKTEETEETS